MRIIITLAAVAVLFPTVSHAENWSLSTWQQGPRSQVAYEQSSITKARPHWRETARHRHHRAAAQVKHEPEARLYRAEDKPTRSMQCIERVTVVGSQWATEAGAEESAQKAWMEAVRWSHGEMSMDMKNAEGYARRCSRSSIGEVVGQTFHRCEVTARPCRPAMVGREH